jgi:hypothetical protein
MIQKSARLRMGDAKQKLVQQARKAIKTSNFVLLMKIIKVGHQG